MILKIYLLYMVDKRIPCKKSSYEDILDCVENIRDYFDYKISYFKTNKDDGFFPSRIDHFVPIEMTDEQANIYNKLKSEGIPKSESDKPNSFYIAERFASNMIDNKSNDFNNPKIKYIINLIKTNPKNKFIIYCGLTEYGLNSIESSIVKLGLNPVRISGKESTSQKELAKMYFNYYNFNNDTFFDISNIPIDHQKFINNKHNVLLISF